MTYTERLHAAWDADDIDLARELVADMEAEVASLREALEIATDKCDECFGEHAKTDDPEYSVCSSCFDKEECFIVTTALRQGDW